LDSLISQKINKPFRIQEKESQELFGTTLMCKYNCISQNRDASNRCLRSFFLLLLFTVFLFKISAERTEEGPI